MKRLYRRLLLFSSLVVFMATAPLVILYALGYRANLQAIDPLPVGVAIIETTPRRAQVTVNGKAVGASPESVGNLPAGDTTIRVELAGYIPWEKTISIEPARATELRDIRLFPSTIEPAAIAQDVSFFSLAPNRQLIAVVTAPGSISVIDQTGEEVTAPITLNRSAPTDLLWSPNSASLAVATRDNTWWLVDAAASRSPRRLTQLSGARDVVWDPRIPGRLLYLAPTGIVHGLNVGTNSRVTIANNVTTFATSSRHVFVLDQTGAVTSYTLQGDVVQENLPSPTGTIERLLITPGGQIAYHLSDTSVWLLKTDNKLVQITAAAQAVGWSPDARMLYLQIDDQSLHVYNATDERAALPLEQLQLITRLSMKIVNPQWFAGGRHLLYQVADQLLITEIDTRDHPITYQVDTTNTGNALPTVGEDGASLFYLKTTAGQTELIVTPLIVNPR